MGARYTTPFDHAAGPDGHRRPLTVAQADDALYRRLCDILRAVDRVSRVAIDNHGPWSPVLPELLAVEELVQELIEDADYTEIAPYSGARGHQHQ